MSKTNDPPWPLPLKFAVPAILLLGLGPLYVRATQTDRPHWVELAAPLMFALIGLVSWTYPEHLPFPSTAWRRGYSSLFFAMSAFMLILYFV